MSAPKRDVPNRRETDRWHIGKEIPIPLIAAIIFQTIGGIWWIAQLSSKIDTAIATMAEFKAERYTRDDARRDRELLEQKFVSGAARDAEIDRRVSAQEARLDRLERK